MGVFEETQARLAEDLITRRRAATGTATTPLTFDSSPLTTADPETGLVRGTVASLVRGVAQVPVMGGHALEANPEADLTGGPRTFANRMGKVIADTAEGVRDSVAAPNSGTSEFKRSVFGGVESLPGSLAYVAPSVAGSLAGQALVPIPGVGAVAGAAAASAATYPIMQKSTYQDTYEALKKEQAAGRLKPGTTEQQIVDAATKAGHYEAAPEAATNLGEALLYTLPGGKAVSAIEKVGARLLSKATGKQLLKNYAGSLMMEVPSEMVTGYGQQEAVNSVTAKPDTTPEQAALDSIGPTAVMTALMAGGGTVGQHLKQRLDNLATKIDTEATSKDVVASTGEPTPRATQLLAALEGVAPDNLTRTSALLNSIPNTGVGTLDPTGAVGPTESPYVADAESFPGASADLLTRRQEAEARNAAAFDSANPVVPNAPENNYVPQVIPELGPPPAEVNLDLGSVGLPATAPAEQSPYASLDGTTRSHEVSRRRSSDPSGWQAAWSAAQQEVGGGVENAKATVVRALDLHDAAQTAARQGVSPVTGADYSQLTPEESNQLYMERYAADPDGWTQAMNNRANRGEATNDAHANRVSALAGHDQIVAARQAAELPAPPAEVTLTHSVQEVADGTFAIHDTTGQRVAENIATADEAQQLAQSLDSVQTGGAPNGQMQGAAPQEVETSHAARAQASRMAADHLQAQDPARWQRAVNATNDMNRGAHDNRVAAIEHFNRTAASNPGRDALAAQGVTAPAGSTLANAVDSQMVLITPHSQDHTIGQIPGGQFMVFDNRMGAAVQTQLSTLAEAQAAATQWDTAWAQHPANPSNAQRVNTVQTQVTPPPMTTLQNISTIMERETGRVPTPAEALARYDAIFGPDVDPDNTSVAMEQRAATNLTLWNSLRQQYPAIIDRIDAFDAQNTTQVAVPAGTSSNAGPNDQYTNMSYTDLQDALGSRPDTAMANSCYGFAHDNATPATPMEDIYRAALREYDFRQANPVANNPPNVVPLWADNNDTLTQAEGNARRELERTQHQTYVDLYNEVGIELTNAGINPARHERALYREMLRRYDEYSTQPVDGVNGTMSTRRATNGTFMVIDQSGTIVNQGFQTRGDAYNFAQREFAGSIPSTPVPGTVPSQQATPESIAPTTVAEIVAGAPNHATHGAFIEWVYGDNMSQQSVRSSVDDIYSGPITDRISRANGWPNSAHKQRLILLLTGLRDAGYTTLSQVHTGHAPVAPTPPVVVASTFTPEVQAIVEADPRGTSVEQTEGVALKELANKISRSINGTGGRLGTETQSLWKNLFENVFTGIARKVERFRYGTSPTTTTTIQGVMDDLNAHEQAIGSGMEIRINSSASSTNYSVPTAGRRMYVQVRHNGGAWANAVEAGGGSVAYAMNDQNARAAGDGAYAYYALQLVARNVPGVNIHSHGMTAINQIRRVEHAFSFLARYGSAPDVSIEAYMNEGQGSTAREIMRSTSPLTVVAARQYEWVRDIFPSITRYKINLQNGRVTANGVPVPVRAITTMARNGSVSAATTAGVGSSGNSRAALSDAVILRTLITQELLRKSTQQSRPGVQGAQAAVNAVTRARSYSDLIFYNRTEGIQAKSDLQASTLQKALAPITDALKGLIPVNVIQTMAHLPGYHDAMPAFNAAYHDGAIYVVADQVTSVAEAKRLVLDHELRHAGLRQVLGKGMDTFLKQAWYAKSDEIKGFANSKGIDTSTVEGRLEAAEEFIVSLAQEAKSHPLLDRAIAKIRSLLRAIGFDLNLSRGELRAMVAKASMLKESVAQDGTTRFSRADAAQAQAPVDHTVDGFYRSARNKFKSMRAAARGAEWVTQLAMPIDRLVDLALLNAVYKPIHALLPTYLRQQREMQNIQDQIVGDAGRRYEKYEAVNKTQAERDNFNSIMRDGTLWGIHPEGGRVTWTNEEWNAEMREKTGLTLTQAFKSLNDRYNSMNAAQQAQYHATIKDMETLRNRYQKSMQDFVIKITPETTLANATTTNNTVSLKDAEGKNFTMKQNEQGEWELRSGDARVIKTGLDQATVAEGLLPQGKRESMLGKVNKKFQGIKGPYAPLSRFGDIVVNVFESATDLAGEVSEDRTARYHFEKESDAQEMMARMRAEGFKVTIEESAQSKSMRAQVPSEFVTELGAAIERMTTPGMSDEQRANLEGFGKQIQEDMERIWMSMTPESSALKHTMKRTGLAGFDEDMMRGYVGYAQRHARGIAYLDRGVAIRETTKAMRENIADATNREEDARASKRMVDHLENHEATVRGEKLSELTQHLTRFPFLWYLSSPSVFLVQSAQPFIMTLPKLAVKFGYGKSLAAITKAYAMQANMKDKPFSNERLDRWHQTAELYVNRQAEGLETDSLIEGLSHEEKTLLGMAIAVKRGQIDITMTHEAMNILKGNVKGIGDKVTEKAAFLMQLSELMSRKAAFAATFGMEMERHSDFTKAVDNSVEVLRDTLYDYSRANRPGFMLGNAGRVLFQFQIFRVHTLSKMLQLLVSSATGDNKKAAIHEFSLMMGNTMLAAGVTGLPFLSTVMGAFAFVFGNDDEPWDFDVYMRSLLGDGVVGDALLKGAPALFGMDISRRVGMSGITDLFAGEPPAGVKGAQLYSYYAGKALGPLGGVASDVLFKAPEMVKQGQWTELLEQTTPKPVKDMMTGYNTMFGEGKYTGKGKLLVDSADMTIWDSVLAMGGVNPTKISNAQEQNFNAMKLSASVNERRGTLQKQLQRAVISQDPDKIDAATDKIATFNERMPQFAITKQQIASGIKQAMRKEMGLEDKNIKKIKQKYGIGQGA